MNIKNIIDSMYKGNNTEKGKQYVAKQRRNKYNIDKYR